MNRNKESGGALLVLLIHILIHTSMHMSSYNPQKDRFDNTLKIIEQIKEMRNKMKEGVTYENA